MIACIVVCDIGFMVAIGWTLGIIESICVTVVVGLSVDFVVHLAHAFEASDKKTRYKKMRQSLTELGVSVLAASITTFLASILLFPTIVTFFTSFGHFLAATMAISAAFAFVAFPTVMMICGPTFHWFSILHWGRCIWDWCQEHRDKKHEHRNKDNVGPHWERYGR
eukprot:gb/GECH01003633.1/.p1 GENE.gb/GECH01003633.1/~~gb/GECH01003633.1/.p1  ORF type:complete len:166 (+),score=10.45 gb/GECH01003633.1/:1-498(+)